MSETTISVKKYVLTNGIAFGLAWVLLGLFIYLSGDHIGGNWIFSLIEFLIHIFFIFFGIYSYKRANKGFLTLKKAIIIGLGVALIGSLLHIIWDIFLLKVISPETMEQLIQINKNQVPNSNEYVNNESKLIFTRSLVSLVAYSIFGFLISILTGAIMQKNPDPFD